MVYSQGGQGSNVHLTHALPDPGPESPGPRLGTGSVQPPLTSDTPTGCVITQAIPSSRDLAGGEEELGACQAPGVQVWARLGLLSLDQADGGPESEPGSSGA